MSRQDMVLVENQPADDNICGGCGLSVESESHGVVFAFGSALWHVKCFKCAKCSKRLNPDMEVLLLSNGSPLCVSCSSTCTRCGLPISQDPVMTDHHAFHAHCFNCRTCGKRIQELIFAKTKEGKVYCMNCHGERVAKIRKQAERKMLKNRAASAGTGASYGNAERKMDNRFPSLEPTIPLSAQRSVSSPTTTQHASTSTANGSAAVDSPTFTPTEPAKPEHVKRISISQFHPITHSHTPPKGFKPQFLTQTSNTTKPRPHSTISTHSFKSVDSLTKEQQQGHFPSERYAAFSNSQSNSAAASAAIFDSYSLALPSPHPYSSQYQPQPSPEYLERRRASADDGVSIRSGSSHLPSYYTRRESTSGNRGSDFLDSSQLLASQSTSQAKDKLRRRSFDPLTAIIDGMERPHAIRSKPLNDDARMPPKDSQPAGNDEEDDTENDIPPALREYFEDVLIPSNTHDDQEDETARGVGSFFEDPTPSPTLQMRGLLPMRSQTLPQSETQPQPQASPKAWWRSSRDGEEQSSGMLTAHELPTRTLSLPENSPGPQRFSATLSPLQVAGTISPPPTPNLNTNIRPTVTDAFPRSRSVSPRPVRSRPRTREMSIPRNVTSEPENDSELELDLDRDHELDTESEGVPPPALPPKSQPRRVDTGKSSLTSIFMQYASQNQESSPTAPLLTRSETPPSVVTLTSSNSQHDETPIPIPRKSPRRPQSLTLNRSVFSHPSLGGAEAEQGTSPDTDQESGSNGIEEQDSTSEHITTDDGNESESQDLTHPRLRFQAPPALPPIRISQFFISSPGLGPDASESESEHEKIVPKQEMDSIKKQDTEFIQTIILPPSQVDATIDDKTTTPTPTPQRHSATLNQPFAAPPPVPVDDDNGERAASDMSHTSSQSSRPPVPSKGDMSTVEETVKLPISYISEPHTTSTSTPTTTRAASPESPEPISEVPPDSQPDTPSIQVVSASQKDSKRGDVTEVVVKSLKELISDAAKRGSAVVKLDRKFVEVIRKTMESNRNKYLDMKAQVDAVKRASQQFVDGLSATQEEYDRELASRRDAEAEIRRLRALVQEQSAKLSNLSSEQRKRDLLEKSSKDITTSLVGLEKDLSKLKVERDLTIAEVAELSASKSDPSQSVSSPDRSKRLSSSLSIRFDGIKSKYRRELEPLTEQREALLREIDVLKESRKAVLEETTSLHARNEELSDLNSQIARSIELSVEQQDLKQGPSVGNKLHKPAHQENDMNGTSTDTEAQRLYKGTRANESQQESSRGLFKWPKKDTPTKSELSSLGIGYQKAIKNAAHSFTQLSLLRVTRCDHCNDKMWGSQLRCQPCGISVHPRCMNHVQTSCSSRPMSPNSNARAEFNASLPLQPSMFGRDLIEQVRADSKGQDRFVPVIVEKCINAVQELAMDYEGVYRKSGGTGQTRVVTQLFERGNYDSFDLKDSDLVNDISSITSVLKSYFRALPNPLLTFALHETFVDAATIRDASARGAALTALVAQLPREHYETLRMLMLHLYEVQERQSQNRMDARNLGLVFGPTLMRSSDPAREFGDMAGKAQTVEWLVFNAPTVFREKYATASTAAT